MVRHPANVSKFARGLTGRRIKSIGRRGKYLLFELDQGKTLALHLGMSGSLRLVSTEEKTRSAMSKVRTERERIRLELSGGQALSFEDTRVFGKVFLYGKDEMPKTLEGMRSMGREPIERGFSAGYLRDWFRGRKTAVKNLLLDQRICCGVGNIYANEALHRAGIRPNRQAGKLGRQELDRLSRALREVLQDGIRWCGTTLDDDGYRLPDGGRGEFQRHLRVMGREGERCRCGAKVRRVKLGGRSSYYCPGCQS